MRLSVGLVFKNRYQLTAKLGEGGMAEVWEALDQRKRLRVAVKVATTSGWRAKARFRRECQIGDLLGQEAGFIRVVDFDAEDPTWMVMDLVPGASPLGRGVRRPVKDPGQRLALLRQLRDAARLTRRAHEVGIIHRDIKPGNILVDAGGAVFLADFGLAKHPGMDADLGSTEPDHRTRTGDGFGTIVFMAPEQASNAKDAGPPADVFSLAATLFAVLGLSPPYGGSESDVYVNLRDAAQGRFRVPSLKVELPWIPEDLDRVCQAALSIRPTARPSSREFADTLERALAELEAAPAPPPQVTDPDGPSASFLHDPSALFGGAAEDSLPTDVLFPDSDEESVNEYIPSGPYSLYAWQSEALLAWERAGRRGVIEAVTGAGKSIVGVEAVKRHLASGGSAALVVVPTRPLVKQWARTFSNLAPDLRVGRFLGGVKDSFRNSDVIVATIQSLPGLSVPSGALLVADECHHYGGVELVWDRRLKRDVARPGIWTNTILGLPVNHRIGLTATVERADGGHDTALVDAIGKVVFSLDYARALRERVVAPFRIAFIRCAFGDSDLEDEYRMLDRRLAKLRKLLVGGFACSGSSFGQFLKDVQALAKAPDGKGRREAGEYLNKFARRRQILGEVATKFEVLRQLVPCVFAADKALVFTETRKGGGRSFDLLDSMGVAVGYVDGSVTDRSQLLSRFGRSVSRAGALKAIVSPKVLDEGVDVPSADFGVVLAASSSRRQMVQRLGRVIRKKADGRRARLAVLVVKDTNEDPASGAHEDFIQEVLAVLGSENWRCFEATEHVAFVPWLNDFGVRAASGAGAGQAPIAFPDPSDRVGSSMSSEGIDFEDIDATLTRCSADLVREATKSIIPAEIAKRDRMGLLKAGGKTHYIRALVESELDAETAVKALLQSAVGEQFLERAVGSVAQYFIEPDLLEEEDEDEDEDDDDEIETPQQVLAEVLLSTFSRGEMLDLAQKGGLDHIKSRTPADEIAEALSILGGQLADVMAYRQIQHFARVLDVPASGTGPKMFARAATALAARSTHFEEHFAMMLTKALTKDQLLGLAQRLDDPDVRASWKKDAIADEVVKHQDGACIDALTVADLRDLLGRWEMSKSGPKAVLLARVALDLIDHVWEVGP